MREDILGGLRNALERGQGIDEAIKSFTSAGYDAAEVQSAAEFLTHGENIQPDPNMTQTANQRNASFQSNPVAAQQNAQSKASWPTHQGQIKPLPQQQQMQQMQQKPAGGVSKVWIITLSIVLLILVGFLVGSIFFKEQVFGLFGG